MKKRNTLVPQPPPENLAISQEDLQRLNSWLEFFRQLSPRVKVIQALETELEILLEALEKEAREENHITEDSELVGWPKARNVAFVIMMNSAPPGSEIEEWKTDNKYIFCFDNVAFGAGYFEWDGDPDDECVGSPTYSLSGYPEDSLYWDFVRSLIVEKVVDLEQRVPAMKM